ncbi:MAG: glycoside hydrolase [Anaerolineae bacterium]|nr:glycoside hydrolase [Chloroflexota bacterium]MBN8638013.1 glycoside hydrolase [Anaerolineae bacterium]
MLKFSLLFAFSLLLTTRSTTAQPTEPPRPPAEGAFFTGEYPNLLAEWGLSTAEIQARIESTFQQLFYGNDATERIYYPVEPNMAYIEDINNQDIRSEGMSYGMMIAVQLDKQAEFNRLWTWARTYMYHEAGAWAGYFCWHARTDGSCIDPNPASDGEIWFVTALFFAAARWGNGDGIYNYQAEANSILRTMLTADTPQATTLFNLDNQLVVFVPQKGAVSRFTNPSYQAPHFYELWARWADQENDFWTTAADAARAHWRAAAHPETGLMSNYTTFAGEPMLWDSYSAVYYADAWRIGMMIALDTTWFAADDWQIEQTNRYLRFFHNLGIGRYTSQFQIDGTPVNNQHRSGGHSAMNAAAALASTDVIAWDFIEEFWETPTPTGRYRYYDGLLQFMALLQLSGNFRIYAPA